MEYHFSVWKITPRTDSETRYYVLADDMQEAMRTFFRLDDVLDSVTIERMERMFDFNELVIPETLSFTIRKVEAT